MTKMTIPAGERRGYTAAQISLHWLIAALVVFQLLFGEDIKPAYRAAAKGAVPSSSDVFEANLHVYIGLAVLALAIVRLMVRIFQGVPPLPHDESVVLKRLAESTHALLYTFIFGMPITGALAWYLQMKIMGELHELAKPVIIVVVALHALAALWQHFFVGSDVLVRMLKPAGRGPSQARR
jgi:cytochrome b561